MREAVTNRHHGRAKNRVGALASSVLRTNETAVRGALRRSIRVSNWGDHLESSLPVPVDGKEADVRERDRAQTSRSTLRLVRSTQAMRKGVRASVVKNENLCRSAYTEHMTKQTDCDRSEDATTV